MHSKPPPSPVASRLLAASLALLIVIGFGLYLDRRSQTSTASPSPSPSASVSPSPTPTPSSTVSASPSPSVSASPTPSASPSASSTPVAQKAYSNTAFKWSVRYPNTYKALDMVYDNGLQKSDRYLMLTTDKSQEGITIGRCSGSYLFSVVQTSTAFSEFGKNSSWQFIDSVKISDTTVGGKPAYLVTGTYNQKATGVTVGSQARITLVNPGDYFLQLTSCLNPGQSLNTAEYDQISSSLHFD